MIGRQTYLYVYQFIFKFISKSGVYLKLSIRLFPIYFIIYELHAL